MNRRSLTALLLSFESSRWLDCTTELGSSMKVLPVIKYNCNENVEHQIGITESGGWAGLSLGSNRVFSEEKLVCFLTLLEFGWQGAIKMIVKSIAEVGLPDNVIKTFPFDSLLLFALRSHWGNLADEWLESGYPLSAQIILDFPNHKLVRKWEKRHIETAVQII